MNPAALFIRRPVATTLLMIGIAIGGALAFFKLPLSPLPQVDFPTISVTAQMPGASPDVMAATVATPLERHLGQIADVTEMTSTSSTGSSRITLQFGLDRNIDGAARDVQAAINAAHADLPSTLRSNPTYRKVNPADSPILILALTSRTLTPGQLYDAADTILAQKLSQVAGIGQVTIGGSSLPAVRVEINPRSLFKYRIGLEDVRAALAAANANSPKGSVDITTRRYQLYTNDQASRAAEYRNLVIAYRNGAAVRLSDVAELNDSVENVRNLGVSEGRPAVLVTLYRQPGANIVDAVDRVKALIPVLEASIPADIDVTLANDHTFTIRASLRDVEWTLLISIALVVFAVFLFLRNGSATLIPAVAVPISLLGTFGAMYLLGYSLDNLSLMALIVATGFVVDDAIVVLENITRHMEEGMPRMQAAMLGAREVGFTVLSMSISLIAVFLPILLMGGIVGRLFREFSITLSVAVLISLVVSLTTTPMLCSRFLKHHDASAQGRFFQAIERAFEAMLRTYARSLRRAMANSALVLMILAAVVVFNVYLYVIVPKGFFPQQDTGRLAGAIQADQSISFQAMQKKLQQFTHIIKEDPAVQTVVGSTGGGSQGGAQINTGSLTITLRPKSERDVSADQVIARLRPRLAQVAGARIVLQSIQDIRMGGRTSNAQYQYTLQGDDVAELYRWAPILAEALSHEPAIADVNSDQQQSGLEVRLAVDRDSASRLQLNPATIDNTLYDAFGQRDVSTIYSALNQYHVVMEVAPQYWESPGTLDYLWISTAGGSVSGTQSSNAVAGTVTAARAGARLSAESLATDAARNQATNGLANSGRGGTSTGSSDSTTAEQMVPLAAISHFQEGNTALAVNHQGAFVATTMSFNLAANASLSDAMAAVRHATEKAGLPDAIRGSFQGTARTFQQSLDDEPILILSALAAVYIVLGILYESYIHPVTILSTLPSAGTGAVLALLLFKAEFSIIALIGVILLIGIVKKNAIMMIDFALDAQRRGASAEEAIRTASLLRFRPIMMTTMTAMLGALPLTFGQGEGAEIRQPLGIAIVGGLLVSQILTLYTTPVMYLFLDRIGAWGRRSWSRFSLMLGAAILTGCAVGPNYQRPAAPVPARYKEAEGWKPTQPQEAASTTAWWSVFDDPVLDTLEQQIDVSNQTLKASEAAWRQAVAAAGAAGAQLYPTLDIDATGTRSQAATSAARTATGNQVNGTDGTNTTNAISALNRRPAPLNVFSLNAAASWDLDLWGKIRRTIESDLDNARASEADLAAARLSAQAALATDYIDLRVSDEQRQLLVETIEAYKRALQITENQYAAGIVAKADVITARTQLKGAQSQEIGLGVQRSQLEHAIAVLVGKPPADLVISPATLGAAIPVAPTGIPSELLERRPDIAAAEHNMAAANARIGVAIAGYFPDLTLSASYGFTNTALSGLIKTPNNAWSVGATAAETVLDFGKRKYQVREARAAYDGSVANYRQTVLGAFQQVEDQLAALQILEEQARVATETVESAREAASLTLNQYKAGTVAYTAVITAQAIALSDAQSLVTIRQRRLEASIALIQALGGGWVANRT